MLSFKTPTIEDKFLIGKILGDTKNFGSENTFGNIFLWRNYFGTKICVYENYLLKMYKDKEGNIGYASPVGVDIGNKNECKRIVDILINDAKDRGVNFVLNGLLEEEVKILESIFPNRFSFSEQRDSEDYIYKSSDLVNLKGKKYHGKRNHIAKFKKIHEFEYEDLLLSNINECSDFIDLWFKENNKQPDISLEYEYLAIKEMLLYYKELNFKSGIIRINKKIVAFTAGEELNKDTFVIHFEKAFHNYEGVYSVINNEFAKRNLEKYIYINREEDMGLPGLRKSKLSYHPYILLKRYKAKFCL